MKIIQVPYCYYPNPVGGTEVYVEALSEHINRAGHESIIAAPNKITEQYEHKGVKVRRYAISEGICALDDLYGMKDDKATYEFAKILDEEKPDIVHMHALTRGVFTWDGERSKKKRDTGGFHISYAYGKLSERNIGCFWEEDM